MVSAALQYLLQSLLQNLLQKEPSNVMALLLHDVLI